MKENYVEKENDIEKKLKQTYRQIASLIHPDKFKGKYKEDIHFLMEKNFQILGLIYDSNDIETNKNRTSIQNKELLVELTAFKSLAEEMIVILDDYNNDVLDRNNSKVEAVFKFNRGTIDEKMSQDNSEFKELREKYFVGKKGAWFNEEAILKVKSIYLYKGEIMFWCESVRTNGYENSFQVSRDKFEEKIIDKFEFLNEKELEEKKRENERNSIKEQQFNSVKEELVKELCVGEGKMWLDGSSSVKFMVESITFEDDDIYVNVKEGKEINSFRLDDFKRRFILIN